MPRALQRNSIFEDRSLRGLDYCAVHTDLIESWLADVWQWAIEKSGIDGGVALVALGGQGRREVAPYSDLDLLLVVSKGTDPGGLAESLWYPIWDSGLKLGHSVRSVRDTLTLAGEDLETATSLLSARHLFGDGELTAELSEKSRINWRKKGRKWLEELANSVERRHASNHEVAFALEPDIKDGRGGLRDLHALRWAESAGAELTPGFLDSFDAEYAELTDVRVELHRAQARAGDRLLLQEQDNVAARLSLENADELMAQVATAGRSLAFASDEAWYDIKTALSGSFLGKFRQDRSLDQGAVITNGRVSMDSDLIEGDPFASLKVANLAAAEGVRILPETLEALQSCPAPPNPWPDEGRELFASLLLAGPAAIGVVEILDRMDLWVPLMPEWAPTRSRPQRNAYHRFTVDRHLLETASNAAAISQRVHRPDLLVMGALLHDIAKAYPELGDHSEAGAEMAETIARRMGFDSDDVATIRSMVRHHLLFPDVATRRDLGDESTIKVVAEHVKTADRVALLAALTEADSIATGPSAWSPWKADLVDQLARRTSDMLGATQWDEVQDDDAEDKFPTDEQRLLLQGDGVDVITAGDRVTVCCPDRPGVFYRAAGALVLHGLDVVEASLHSENGRALDSFKVRAGADGAVPWDRVSTDMERALRGQLALQSRVEERVRAHVQRNRSAVHQLSPTVRWDDESSNTATVIELVGPDSPGLLYRVARSLAEFHVYIEGARIHTLGDDVIDALYITDEEGGPVTDPLLRDEIERALLYALEVPA